MDVFLVPVGRDNYELYCEHVDEPEAHGEGPPSGFMVWIKSPSLFFAWLKYRFHRMLVDAERERRRGYVASDRDSWFQRTKRWIMRWVAESIAEQRLLWNLRRHDDALLHYPDDIPEATATGVMKAQLARDFDKHRFWLVINSILMVVSAALILIPGPNIIGYYFAFRVVGHFFSVRGARNGLDRVRWTSCASGPLTDLRDALSLDAAGRLRQAEDVASRLRLEHLATFFQRTAVT
jgi:hypothetical protein